MTKPADPTKPSARITDLSKVLAAEDERVREACCDTYGATKRLHRMGCPGAEHELNRDEPTARPACPEADPDPAEERCGECSPSFGCWSGELPCRKTRPAEERGGVEAGPAPVSPLPWAAAPSSCNSGLLWDGGKPSGIGDTVEYADAAAIVHRVNNWPALLAERDVYRSMSRSADAEVRAAELLRDDAIAERDTLRAEADRLRTAVGAYLVHEGPCLGADGDAPHCPDPDCRYCALADAAGQD